MTTYTITTTAARSVKNMKTGIRTTRQPLCTASVVVDGETFYTIRRGETRNAAIVNAIAALDAKIS